MYEILTHFVWAVDTLYQLLIHSIWVFTFRFTTVDVICRICRIPRSERTHFCTRSKSLCMSGGWNFYVKWQWNSGFITQTWFWIFTERLNITAGRKNRFQFIRLLLVMLLTLLINYFRNYAAFCEYYQWKKYCFKIVQVNLRRYLTLKYVFFHEFDLRFSHINLGINLGNFSWHFWKSCSRYNNWVKKEKICKTPKDFFWCMMHATNLFFFANVIKIFTVVSSVWFLKLLVVVSHGKKQVKVLIIGVWSNFKKSYSQLKFGGHRFAFKK